MQEDIPSQDSIQKPAKSLRMSAHAQRDGGRHTHAGHTEYRHTEARKIVDVRSEDVRNADARHTDARKSFDARKTSLAQPRFSNLMNIDERASVAMDPRFSVMSNLVNINESRLTQFDDGRISNLVDINEGRLTLQGMPMPSAKRPRLSDHERDTFPIYEDQAVGSPPQQINFGICEDSVPSRTQNSVEEGEMPCSQWTGGWKIE